MRNKKTFFSKLWILQVLNYINTVEWKDSENMSFLVFFHYINFGSSDVSPYVQGYNIQVDTAMQ